jgi:hypothetical protein
MMAEERFERFVKWWKTSRLQAAAGPSLGKARGGACTRSQDLKKTIKKGEKKKS